MCIQVIRSAMAGALLALGLLAPGIVAAVGGPIDLVLETRKVDTAGGALNRYAMTDRDGDGYGVYLSYPSGRLVLERRDAWGSTHLAASANTLIGGMALGQWYTLRLRFDNGQLIADAYPGEVDPATATPEVTVMANDPNYAEFTQLNAAGGRTYDTDDISVVADGQLVLAEDFDDGTIFAWGTFLSGQIALAPDPSGGFVLRKSGFDDPNGGSVGLFAPALDLRLATRRVDLSGGGLNRYSLTDADGNGFGVSLNATNGRLVLERRDGWAATTLARQRRGAAGQRHGAGGLVHPHPRTAGRRPHRIRLPGAGGGSHHRDAPRSARPSRSPTIPVSPSSTSTVASSTTPTTSASGSRAT